MKELIAESVNDVFDEDATADDVEDMEDYKSSYTPIRIAKTAVRRSLLQAFAMIIPTANGLFSTCKPLVDFANGIAFGFFGN